MSESNNIHESVKTLTQSGKSVAGRSRISLARTPIGDDLINVTQNISDMTDERIRMIIRQDVRGRQTKVFKTHNIKSVMYIVWHERKTSAGTGLLGPVGLNEHTINSYASSVKGWTPGILLRGGGVDC